MKKTLLSVFALASIAAFAQTNSDASGNKPAANADGYAFEYMKSTNELFASKSINCLDDAGIHSGAGTYDYDDTKEVALFKTDGGTGAMKVLFTTGNCSNTIGLRGSNDGIDVSTPEYQQITIELNSSVEAHVIVNGIFGAGGVQGGKYMSEGTAYWADAVKINVGANTIKLPYFPAVTQDGKDTDLAAASSGKNGMLGLYLYFRDGAAFANALPENTTFEIKSIHVGNAMPVGVQSKVAQEVAVYPNPSSTEVNFGTELQNVTIYNVLGMVVYQSAAATTVDVSSFDSGLYYVQHAKGTTKFSVK